MKELESLVDRIQNCNTTPTDQAFIALVFFLCIICGAAIAITLRDN